ncbi:MAG: poly-beta-1,6-N-acetyl-D-glucosamine N-deacetylase PgaB [Candidatus Saccharibacteria bacterium]|nr:poly-beta-1,6-N-acetyl-D-glucosamine N-deacetylase PgaB [Moraxellaceae bacterium]
MTRLLAVLTVWMLCLTGTQTFAALPTELTVISYHEIADKKNALIPQYAVSPTNFVRQMDWLKNNGYHFVSVDQVLAARTGKLPLPERAVLITFDDGYRSVYTNAFPILKLFDAPAVIAVVGSWLEPTSGEVVNFDGRSVSREEMLSWAQIKEMTVSGLVEVGSHTYGLHDGISANPQGNMEPAVTTRIYSPNSKSYEAEDQYKKRLYNDLKKNNDLLHEHGIRAPRVIAWPYGSYNIEARVIAEKLGMPIGLTLDDGPNTVSTPLWSLRRILVESNMQLSDLQHELVIRDKKITDQDRPEKIMHIDLDYIYDADPAQQEKNLGHLLDRIIAMGVNTIYLQAFADPDADGSADMVYFPNRHMPMRADLFNRVSWQIRTRTPVKRIFAWMPMMAWNLPAREPAAQDLVVTEQAPNADHLNMGYHRLSPYSPRARQVIRDIYQDLSRAAPIDGLLFHDDVTLSDYEDGSRFGIAQNQEWGLPSKISDIRKDDDLLGRWTILKINALDRFAKELADLVTIEQPNLLTARNLYAQVVLNPQSEVWYAQSLDNSLANYDFTAIMAMPYMEKAKDPKAFMQQMIEKVKQHPNAMRKVVFELQTVDWRTDKKIPSTELAETIKSLYAAGVQHVAYYPDDSIQDHPDAAILRPVFDGKSNLPVVP